MSRYIFGSGAKASHPVLTIDEYITAIKTAFRAKTHVYVSRLGAVLDWDKYLNDRGDCVLNLHGFGPRHRTKEELKQPKPPPAAIPEDETQVWKIEHDPGVNPPVKVSWKNSLTSLEEFPNIGRGEGRVELLRYLPQDDIVPIVPLDMQLWAKETEAAILAWFSRTYVAPEIQTWWNKYFASLPRSEDDIPLTSLPSQKLKAANPPEKAVEADSLARAKRQHATQGHNSVYSNENEYKRSKERMEWDKHVLAVLRGTAQIMPGDYSVL